MAPPAHSDDTPNLRAGDETASASPSRVPTPSAAAGAAAKRGKPKRILYSHFMSVPLNGDAERVDFQTLKTAIVKNYSATVGPDAFIRGAKFHYTLCMLKLPDAQAVAQARGVVDSCGPELRRIAAECGQIQEGQLCLQFENGVHTFEGRDPAQTNVVFRRPAPESSAAKILQQLGKTLIRAFEEAGLVCSALSDLQLHATLVKGARKYGDKKRFDARELLEAFREWPGSEARVQALHMSMLGSGTEDDGYYKCAHRVPLVQDDAVHV